MPGASSSCIVCQIARSSTSTTLLHSDDKVVAFQDINPSAFRNYLVIPVEHIATVKDLHRTAEDYPLVGHMLNVGQTLIPWSTGIDTAIARLQLLECGITNAKRYLLC